MIHVIPAHERHFTDMDWLKTYWLFSFSNYYDPANLSHGTLRVFNDDIVLSGKGFGRHPHEEMEIISIVLQGEMEHQETKGNHTRIRKNDVQRMTAGTGLQHSEWNNSDEQVAFFQIWVLPETKGLTPSYDQKSFTPDMWRNRLHLLASNRPDNGAVSLNTDALIYRAGFDGEKAVTHRTDGERKLFAYVVEGEAKINGTPLGRRDQARISELEQIEIVGSPGTDVLLIDVPSQQP